VIQRTVTIDTADLGPVTIAEPAWCTGEHPAGLLRSEIAHQGPFIDVPIDTDRGPRRLLAMTLCQDPYPSPRSPQGAEVYVAVHLVGEGIYPYGPTGLDTLATCLMEAAGKVRFMARRLACETPGGAR
jgi:hypothetical protein